MITIKESAPFDLPRGEAYMVRISAKTARAFAGLYSVPAMGHEIVVAIAPSRLGFRNILLLQNLSGDFYLCSPSSDVVEWPNVFKITVQRKEVKL